MSYWYKPFGGVGNGLFLKKCVIEICDIWIRKGEKSSLNLNSAFIKWWNDVIQNDSYYDKIGPKIMDSIHIVTKIFFKMFLLSCWTTFSLTILAEKVVNKDEKLIFISYFESDLFYYISFLKISFIMPNNFVSECFA